jgi:hypothetical protein
MKADKLGMMQYITLSVPHILSVTNLAEKVKLAINVRHLTLTSKEHKKPDFSLHITAKNILPAFRNLKSVRIEFLVPGRRFQNRNVGVARLDCKTFVPMLDSMLGVAGKWTQKGEKMDVWTWKAAGKSFEVVEKATNHLKFEE